MSATGEKGGPPLKAGVPVADFMSGAHLYGAIVTALFERERTGRGRVLEVSMLETMFAPLLPAAGHALHQQRGAASAAATGTWRTVTCRSTPSRPRTAGSRSCAGPTSIG